LPFLRITDLKALIEQDEKRQTLSGFLIIEVRLIWDAIMKFSEAGHEIESKSPSCGAPKLNS
jgi:hypothetical protein